MNFDSNKYIHMFCWISLPTFLDSGEMKESESAARNFAWSLKRMLEYSNDSD